MRGVLQTQGKIVCVFTCLGLSQIISLNSQGEAPNSRLAGGVSRAQNLGLMVFLGTHVKGKHQSGSQEGVWNGCALNPVTNTPEPAHVAVSSAGCKMQVEGK